MARDGARPRLAVAVAFVVAVALGWVITTWVTPRVIMQIAMSRMEDRAGSANRMIRAEPVGPESREVVRPSPDLLYSLCPYDVSDGDVLLRVGTNSDYWSASFYDAATSNFAVLSGSQGAERSRMVRLTKSGQGLAGVVVSPTSHGAILIRRRISGPRQKASAIEAQTLNECATVLAS